MGRVYDGTDTGIQVFIIDQSWEHRPFHADNGISSPQKSRSGLVSLNFLSAYKTERNSKLFDSEFIFFLGSTLFNRFAPMKIIPKRRREAE